MVKHLHHFSFMMSILIFVDPGEISREDDAGSSIKGIVQPQK